MTTLRGETMGTTFTVRIARPLDEPQQYAWQQRIEQRLGELNGRLSTYRADSDVCRFNRSASTDWFAVAADVAEVVAAAQQVAQESDGAFDVTVAPLVNLWSFGPDLRPAGVPRDEEIAAARRRVDFHRLHVRSEPPALRKDQADLNIDLSGIAKGYAVDQIGQLLEAGGVAQYMVEIGGEVRTRGRKHDGSAWRIGVERPVVGQRLVQSVLELSDQALATSGDYRNVFEWEGKWYSHEIDPHTGWPVQHGVASVSVLADSTMWADAYATALIVLPPAHAWTLVSQWKLDVLIVSHTPKGFESRATPGWTEHVVADLE